MFLLLILICTIYRSRDSDWLRAPSHPDRLWVTPNLLSNRGGGVLSLGREAEHSPPTSAEVNIMWFYTSTAPQAYMAQCLIS
jgi:hypothetical protein